nr:transposase [Nitrosomonas sp. Nm33]
MHGYAPLGQRCYGVRDWHAKARTNVIGALIGEFLHTIGLFRTSINADVFYAWTVQDLLPKLPPACVIVMDNAAFHKRQDIHEVIAKAGYVLEYLPVLLSGPQPHRTQMGAIKSSAQKISVLHREPLQ